MPLSAAKNISQKSAARGLSMSQDRPSPLPSRYSIVSSRAGSLPACLNVTDDSEPSVWFSLEGLSLRTRVAYDETALFLSNTTFSPDGMLGSTAGNVQLDSQLIDVMCPTLILGQRGIGIEESK